MKPKKQAKQLVEKFGHLVKIDYPNQMIPKQKQCALICVKGMIDFIELDGNNFNWYYTNDRIRTPLEYWQEVKQELQNYETKETI